MWLSASNELSLWERGSESVVTYTSEYILPGILGMGAFCRFIMEKIDLVIVGAEGVVENGGIINKVMSVLVVSASLCSWFPVGTAIIRCSDVKNWLCPF